MWKQISKKWTRNGISIGIPSSKIVRMMLTLHGKCFFQKYNVAERECIHRKVVKTSTKIFSIPLDRKTLVKRKKKYRLWERYLNTKDAKIYEEYCKCRNQFRRFARKSVKSREMNIAKKPKQIINFSGNSWSHPYRICSYLQRLI